MSLLFIKDIKLKLPTHSFLMYVDNLKVFFEIKSFDENMKLQHNVDLFEFIKDTYQAWRKSHSAPNAFFT